MGKKRIIKKTEEELLKETEEVESGMKKKENKAAAHVPAVRRTKTGRIYISSSYNNTLITLTDAQGNALSQTSAGAIGFKGSKKSTPFAASKVAETIFLVAEKMKITEVAIYVKGIGSGRESAIRALANQGLVITMVKDVTPVPHNGCRPPKIRRV